MHWWYSKNGEVVGPVRPAEMKSLVELGILSPMTQVYGRQDEGPEIDWRPLSSTSLLDLFPNSAQGNGSDLLRKLADYERISGGLWMLLGIFQCLSVVAAIAGVWNIFAAFTRFKMAKRILQGDRDVVSEYEGVTGLLVIGAVNLFLGGVIGIIFVAFDFFVRDKILSNSHLFNRSDDAARPSSAAGAESARVRKEPRVSETNEAVEWLFIAPDGNVYGPTSTASARASHACGDLSADAKVRRWPDGAWEIFSESDLATNN